MARGSVGTARAPAVALQLLRVVAAFPCARPCKAIKRSEQCLVIHHLQKGSTTAKPRLRPDGLWRERNVVAEGDPTVLAAWVVAVGAQPSWTATPSKPGRMQDGMTLRKQGQNYRSPSAPT